MMGEEEVPDHPDDPCGGLEDMSLDDARSFVLSELQENSSQLSSVMVLHLRFFASSRKSPVTFR